MGVVVELFYSPYCRRCADARHAVQAALAALPSGALIYHERNVMEDLERAVELGITATPTLVVAGKPFPVGRWQPQRLRRALAQHVVNGG